MLTAQEIKDSALNGGADFCGIANIGRYQGAPREMHPLTVFPETRSIIVYGSRILKGSYKGIREGTDWSSYWVYGYGPGILSSIDGATEAIIDVLASEGYEAVQEPGGRTLKDEGAPNPPPLAEGKPSPRVTLHTRMAAALAGLGEFGWSKVFLTPQFGPRQRLAVVLTDAELEPDPLFEGAICDHCQVCVRACPGRALGGEKKTVTVEGRTFEWGDVDYGQCKVTHVGLNPKASPFVQKDLPGMQMEVEKTNYQWHEALQLGKALSNLVDYTKLVFEGSDEHGAYGRPGSVCGAQGCVQACNRHLESRGVLKGGARQEGDEPCETQPCTGKRHRI